MFRWLKNSLPRRLYARAALILILPIVTIQLVVSITFLQRHFEDVTRQMTRSVVIEARLLRETIETEGLLRAQQLARALRISLAPLDAAPPVENRRLFYDVSGRTVIEVLRGELDGVGLLDLEDNDRALRFSLDTEVLPVMIELDRRRVSASNPHQLLVLMILVGVLMTVVAYIFLRNQLRPIARLSKAAEAFGKGRVVPYKPSGALEVRAAGHAFLEMRARIERQIEQRTMMLSGVSHDLRTPLTRMQLELSMLPPSPEVAALEQDVQDMSRLLTTFLDFARADALEDARLVNPLDLVEGIVDQYKRTGGKVSFTRPALPEGAPEPQVSLRPMALERALDNLVGNALRYGTHAQVSVDLFQAAVRFSVEDDGPGIPPDQRGQALKPFARLDAARNQNAGTGVGLGLAIAADVARSHGGALRLGVSDKLGGLKADLLIAR
ncbi:ATP-binding protein [Dinoroseobacter sp. PD6]|uniref:ATP-binding protein n=1 Tax=Dinoroseobacter sp. PD6 TaxID=3028384 RepID=UPI00237BDE21|nr:ATP-binding protein [Dinoroseobacter sp. PD6]MDD9715240.1 ATP-binding protein [Dinoroseobacter sp. PD6]